MGRSWRGDSRVPAGQLSAELHSVLFHGKKQKQKKRWKVIEFCLQNSNRKVNFLEQNRREKEKFAPVSGVLRDMNETR